MLRRFTSTTALWVLGAVALASAAQGLSKRDADNLQQKLDAVVARAGSTAPARPLRTLVTDREVNAYFKYQGAEQLPTGVINPIIEILDLGRVSGVVTVDLNAVRKSKARSWLDPVAYMTGSVAVRIVGTLRAANGKGAFQLESATLSGVPLPTAFLQELVAYYTSTPESPKGFVLDQPFELPQKIRQVEFQRGAAVIVQ